MARPIIIITLTNSKNFLVDLAVNLFAHFIIWSIEDTIKYTIKNPYKSLIYSTTFLTTSIGLNYISSRLTRFDKILKNSYPLTHSLIGDNLNKEIVTRIPIFLHTMNTCFAVSEFLSSKKNGKSTTDSISSSLYNFTSNYITSQAAMFAGFASSNILASTILVAESAIIGNIAMTSIPIIAAIAAGYYINNAMTKAKPIVGQYTSNLLDNTSNIYNQYAGKHV